MSEKIKYQFAAMPIKWLVNPSISHTEKIVLCVLIALGDEKGISNIGYEKLSTQCCLNKSYLIKVINRLEKRGYVERIIQHNRRFATQLRVRYELLDGISRAGVQESHLGDSYTEKQESLLNQSGVAFKSIGSRIEATPTIFKSDLNYNKGGSRFEATPNFKTDSEAKEESETPDVAGVRSMPSGAQGAAESSAKDESADAQAAKIQALLPVLSEYFGDLRPWIQVFEVSNKIGIRVLGGRISGVDVNVVKEFAARHGIIFSQQQFANERIIAA